MLISLNTNTFFTVGSRGFNNPIIWIRDNAAVEIHDYLIDNCIWGRADLQSTNAEGEVIVGYEMGLFKFDLAVDRLQLSMNKLDNPTVINAILKAHK